MKGAAQGRPGDLVGIPGATHPRPDERSEHQAADDGDDGPPLCVRLR